MQYKKMSIGSRHTAVLLETYKDGRVSRPRVSPVRDFPPDTKVEFPRDLREEFPIGTKFYADVVVAQKHNKDGSPKGGPYLVASNIGVVVSSIPNVGMRAKLKPGSTSGRSYHYVWDDDWNELGEGLYIPFPELPLEKRRK